MSVTAPTRTWPDLSVVMDRLDPIPCHESLPRWADKRLHLGAWLEARMECVCWDAEGFAAGLRGEERPPVVSPDCGAHGFQLPPEYRDLLAELAAYRERQARAEAADAADWAWDFAQERRWEVVRP